MKSYELSSTFSPDHLKFIARGARTREAVASIAEEIVAKCTSQQVSRVLVDVRNLEGRLSITDSFMLFIHEFPQLRKQGVVKKAAIVDQKSNQERLHFFETIARNRGFKIRTFTDAEEAACWLCEGSERSVELP